MLGEAYPGALQGPQMMVTADVSRQGRVRGEASMEAGFLSGAGADELPSYGFFYGALKGSLSRTLIVNNL